MQNQIPATMSYKDFLLVSAVGLLFLLMNFPKTLSRLVTDQVENQMAQDLLLWPIQATQTSLMSLQGSAPEAVLSKLMFYAFLGFWCLMLLLVVAAIRQKNGALPPFCLAGVLTGFFGLHLISWTALILLKLGIWLAIVVVWLKQILVAILGFFASWWFVWAPLMALALLLIFKREAWDWLRQHWAKLSLGTAAALIALFLIRTYFPPFWAWLMALLEPVIRFFRLVFHFLAEVFGWIFGAGILILAVFLILNVVGRLVVDQIRAAWNSGRSKKELALGGFALGSAFALIVLTSMGVPGLSKGVNTGWQQALATVDGVLPVEIASASLGWIQPAQWFESTMPENVRSFVKDFLGHASAPLVDSLFLLVALIFTNASVLFGGILERQSTVRVVGSYFLPHEYFTLVGGLIGAVGVSFLAQFMEGSDFG